MSLPLESLGDRPMDKREVRVEVPVTYHVLDERFEVIVAIVLRGATVSIMVLWGKTTADWVSSGVEPGSDSSWRMLFFFAGFAMWMGASLSTKCETFEVWLKKTAKVQANRGKVQGKLHHLQQQQKVRRAKGRRHRQVAIYTQCAAFLQGAVCLSELWQRH